jgi:2,5-diamino-6-(ribosylamino)-4(3H)-pyrimidinone 5'-phosphate reductase
MSTEPETPNGHEHLEDGQAESEGEYEGINDTSMQDQDDDDGGADADANGSLSGRQNGRHYTVVEDEPPGYSVFTNPPDLGELRERLFSLDAPVELSNAQWDAYFPFVDNVWRKMRTMESQPEEHKVTVDYYACRLRRANQKSYTPRPTPEGKQPRKKRTREEKTCAMTMKVVFNPGDTCTVSRATDGVLKHSHDLDYADGSKRNTGIMDTARREAARAYTPASIYWKMWEEPEKMHAAGGKFMKMSDVRNVQYSWRQEHPLVPLKAHRGFTLRQGRREPPVPPPAPTAPISQPPLNGQPPNAPPPAGVFGRLKPVKPEPPAQPPPQQDVLIYPSHAREFLEPYLPDPNPAAHNRPHVTLTWASSLDGRISQIPGAPTAISGPETKAMTHYLRSRHDAILIGVSTAVADDPGLNCRLADEAGHGVGIGYQPRPIIVDPHARLRIRPDMRVLKTAAAGRGKAPWVVVAPGAMLHPTAVSTLKQHGGEYLMINDYHPAQGGLNWDGILNVLFREGIKSVMVEGGGIVLSELLKTHRSHLISSVILTMAPAFFGKSGTMVSPDTGFDHTGRPIATRLRNVKWQPMGEADVVMCGHMGVDYHPPPAGMLPGIEEYSRAVPGPPDQQSGAYYQHQPPPQPYQHPPVPPYPQQNPPPPSQPPHLYPPYQQHNPNPSPHQKPGPGPQVQPNQHPPPPPSQAGQLAQQNTETTAAAASASSVQQTPHTASNESEKA